MSEPQTNVIPLGPAVTGNARKAQMVEHFARKLDAVLANGASDLSVVFVAYGYKGEAITHVASWDVAEGSCVPVRMVVTDASAVLAHEASKMRPAEDAP